MLSGPPASRAAARLDLLLGEARQVGQDPGPFSGSCGLHVGNALRPQWTGWPMSAITRMEAQKWVNRLQLTRRARHKGRAVTDDDEDVPAIGAETICASVHVMSQLYDLAVKETRPSSWRTRSPVLSCP